MEYYPADWRRQLGRPRITWLSTAQQDLKQHHFTLPEAADLAQNRPLWRMMSTYGITQSLVACQKRQRLVGTCTCCAHRWLEKTTRSSLHHVAQHRPTGSETTLPYAPRSSRFGSEPPSVEDDVDVWRYAIPSCMPETTTTSRDLHVLCSLVTGEDN